MSTNIPTAVLEYEKRRQERETTLLRALDAAERALAHIQTQLIEASERNGITPQQMERTESYALTQSALAQVRAAKEGVAS